MHVRLQAYTKCAPLEHEENRHVKVIANTKYTLEAGPDPHTFMYTEGKFAVTENFEPVHGPRSEAVSEDQVKLTLVHQSFEPYFMIACFPPHNYES